MKYYLLIVIFLINTVIINGQVYKYINKDYGFSVEFPCPYESLTKFNANANHPQDGYSIYYIAEFNKNFTIDKFKKRISKKRFAILKEDNLLSDGYKVYSVTFKVNADNSQALFNTFLIETNSGTFSLSAQRINSSELIDLSHVYPFIYSFKFADGSKLTLADNFPTENKKYGGPLIGNGIYPFIPPKNEIRYIANSEKSDEYQNSNLLLDPENMNIQNTKSDIDVNVPINSKKNANTFAVIVGNEYYENEINVKYAENDALIFNEYVIKTIGVPLENVHLINNASYGNILRELAWLKNIAKAYDGEASLLFYYAGHGMPDEQTKDSYLLPVDGDASQTISAIKLDWLYESLTQYSTQKTTVILDACFSGSARDGKLASGRGVTIKPKANTLNGNLIVFTAVSEDQTAHPYDEKSHGLFTYYFLKKLQESQGNSTFEELINYLSKEVNRRSVIKGKEQTPKILVSPSMEETWRNIRFNE